MYITDHDRGTCSRIDSGAKSLRQVVIKDKSLYSVNPLVSTTHFRSKVLAATFPMNSNLTVASYADILWARHAPLPHEGEERLRYESKERLRWRLT